MNNQRQQQEDAVMATIDERTLNMINRAIAEQQQSYRDAAQDLDDWHCPSLDSQNFWRLLCSAAQAVMAKRGVYHPFVADDNNRAIIYEMWLYVTGSEKCKWNIHKGIFLGGKIGCGKTVLMQAFCEVLHMVSRRHIEMIPASQLYARIQADGLKYFASRPLFIDDLGRDQAVVNDFGNKMRPINDLITMRYETGARTFFTSNYQLSTLAVEYNAKGELIGYGNYICDRIREMVNVVALPGNSRRERWEAEP